jgi:hypothetical protein
VRGVWGRDNYCIHLQAPQQGREIVVHGWDSMALRKGRPAALVAAQYCH